MYVFLSLVIAAGLGLIPAKIASDKGHSFGLWWFYGFMLFIVAIIHVWFIEDYNNPKTTSSTNYSNYVPPYKSPTTPKTDVPEELMKYKSLLDSGAITQEEYDTIKSKLLNKDKMNLDMDLLKR